jgi:hypothetical protein
MKTMKITSIVILLCVPVLLFACATAKSQYEDTRKINTISAYQEFLSKYPSGKYAELAQTRIEALNFEKAQAANSVEAYESFMLSSQSDLFKNYAIQRIQKIYRDEYVKAKEIDTVKAYYHYMSKYPKSDYLPDCLDRIENLEWGNALKRHDAIGYYQYLNDCSVCERHDREARRRFGRYVKSGAGTDLPSVKKKVEQILSRSDIVVVQSGANKISTKTGSIRFEDLASADDVLISTLKEKKSISAADLAKGNYASIKTLRLRNRVPMSVDNPIGFSTIIFYSQKDRATEILFVENGKGYLFKETGTDIF